MSGSGSFALAGQRDAGDAAKHATATGAGVERASATAGQPAHHGDVVAHARSQVAAPARVRRHPAPQIRGPAPSAPAARPATELRSRTTGT